jgi:putative ABC transport system permease protein
MGYVIKTILDADHLYVVFIVFAAMSVLGAWTAQGRAKKVPGAFWPLLVALGLAAASTLGLVVALGVFDAEARSLVPVGGMVIGNAMTGAAVALNRLGDDVESRREMIEATLALGATSTEAIRPITRASLRSGTIALVDQTKSTGIITFPGVMVGMILGGAEPVDAVRLQMVLLWVLLGAVALSALTAVSLAQRRFFTPSHQLRDDV